MTQPDSPALTTGLPGTADRFGFGRNWRAFSAHVDEARIAEAMRSITALTGRPSLAGVRFLDVGSGSGLFSLAAARLGARVHAFDYDPDSVACTRDLLAGRAPAGAWTAERGSILDDAYLEGLGRFEIVYAWGVLHHTGDLDGALRRVRRLVADGGTTVIALYNDQGWISGYWTLVKHAYNRGPVLRAAAVGLHLPYLAARWVSSTLRRRRPERGMRLWTDFLDWLGGYPFEVARPQAVVDEFARGGFALRAIHTCGRRHGCNEFVFERGPAPDGSTA